MTLYSTIANNGIMNTPLAVISVADNEGREIKAGSSKIGS